MKARTIVVSLSFGEDAIAIDYGRTSDIRDNAGTGSPVVLSHRLEIGRNNKQYRDEIDEIEEKVRDLIADVLEDFEAAEPIDISDETS